MPKGPRGEKRPADAIGCAVMAAQIATDEEQDIMSKPTNRHKSGVAGAKARAESLTAVERRAIARGAADARWKGEDTMRDQNDTSQTKERLPYPANALGEPKKSFEDTFRLSTAVKAAMAKNK